MKRILPIGALITGLIGLSGGLAAPARAGVAAPAVEAFPATMPETVAKDMRRVARGEAPDAYGMRGMRQRMALVMERRLAGLAGHGKFVEVQLTEPKQGELELVMPGAARMEKVTFLGVVATPVPAEMRAQLKLPGGIGLIVDYVDAGSPAEKAGLKVGDILEKLDDQVLINGEQMAVLVRSKKPGETVNLTIVRKGEASVMEAALGEKEIPTAEDVSPLLGITGGVPGGIMGPVLELWGSPEGLGKTWLGTAMQVDAAGTVTRRTVDGQNDITIVRTADGKETVTVKDREGRELFAGPAEELAGAKLPPELMQKIDHLRANPIRVQIGDNGGGAAGGPGTGVVTTSRTFEMNRKDEQYDITLKSDNGDKHVTVKELGTGKVIFDGAANSAEDLRKLPGDVQPRVQAMLEKVK